MALMTARETAALAADVATVQPDSAAVRRASAASDGMGGTTRTWTTVATATCRITPLDQTEAEQVLGDDTRDKQVYRVSLPYGTALTVADRLLINGTTYAVEAVRTNRSLEVERIAYCVKAA